MTVKEMILLSQAWIAWVDLLFLRHGYRKVFTSSMRPCNPFTLDYERETKIGCSLQCTSQRR